LREVKRKKEKEEKKKRFLCFDRRQIFWEFVMVVLVKSDNTLSVYEIKHNQKSVVQWNKRGSLNPNSKAPD